MSATVNGQRADYTHLLFQEIGICLLLTTVLPENHLQRYILLEQLVKVTFIITVSLDS